MLELYQLMEETICHPSKYVHIRGQEIPYENVKNKFLNMNMFHLEYVADCIENYTGRIGNIRSYMLTSLYNAPDTIHTFYAHAVTYHEYGDGRERQLFA